MKRILRKHFLSRQVSRFLIVAFLFIPFSAFGENFRGINVVPDQEARSCMVAAHGYTIPSGQNDMADARARAYKEARKEALRIARTHIEKKAGHTDYELIWSDYEGAVEVLEQKDYGVGVDGRYHVWIRAEVEYDLKEKQKEITFSTAAESPGPLTVKVWTPKKQYRDGETIEVFVRGNRDFYARIVDITVDGSIVQLLPNTYRKANFFKADKTYKIPDEEDQFELRVSSPYGEDQIVVYASEQPLGQVSMEPVGKGLLLFKGSQESLGLRSRGMTIVDDNPAEPWRAEFYESAWTVKTSLDY